MMSWHSLFDLIIYLGIGINSLLINDSSKKKECSSAILIKLGFLFQIIAWPLYSLSHLFVLAVMDLDRLDAETFLENMGVEVSD